jgi:hypothetical protein
MKYTDIYQNSRFWLLLKVELFRSRKGVLITFVVTFGLLFIGFILENMLGSSRIFDDHTSSYTFFLLVGGFILSSLAFSDLGNSLKKSHYLTIPASAFEKFFSMWLLTCIGWIVVFTCLYVIYCILANSAGHLFFRNITFVPFDLFSSASLNSIRYYIIFQGILLVGAVHFKGYVFPKTLFTIILFGMLCGLIFYLIMARIIHTGYDCPANYNPFEEKNMLQIWQGIKWVGNWILAPLCWVITYIGLKEQEV